MTYDAIPDLHLETVRDRRAICADTPMHCKKRATGYVLTQQVRTALEIGEALDDCLLQALEMAVANGDAKAAELIAAECMALVELRRGLLEREGASKPACATDRHEPAVAHQGMVHS